MILRLPAHPADPPLTTGQVYTRSLPRLEGRHSIRIVTTRGQALGAVSVREAQAEGYHSRPAWKAEWVERYDRRWVGRQEQTTGLSDAELCHRFDLIWAPRLSWVHTIAIVEPVRCLPDEHRVRAGQSAQYVGPSMSMDPDVEAVDAASLARIVAHAHALGMRRTVKQARGAGLAQARRRAKS